MPASKPSVARAKPRPDVVDEGVPTIFATRLLFWRRLGDTVWLTFVEDRPHVPDAELLKSHVVARIAMPASNLGGAAALLQDALLKPERASGPSKLKVN